MSTLLEEPARMKKRATAESLAKGQRDISISEFFAKNRHLLGFDNPRKALLTTVKEAVDNSLDACEEAGILPEIAVVIEDLGETAKRRDDPAKPGEPEEKGKRSRPPASSRYRVTVVDNGPGIVRKQVEHIFGRLLYGSKFHRLKMSRGQQGIGISAAGMYGLITTGKPMLIQTRPDARKRAHHIELAMNTKTNRAEVTADDETDDFPLVRFRELGPIVRDLAARGEFLAPDAFPTGTSVTIEMEGKYQRGRGSVDEFLELTAIANPHARITFVRPGRVYAEDADEPPRKPGDPLPGLDAGPPEPAPMAQTVDLDGVVIFPRAVPELPPETREIQPHPKGVELGTLLQMVKDHEGKGATLYSFLHDAFCRVSAPTAAKFCETVGVTSRTKLSAIEPPQVEALYAAFQESKLSPPPTDCLAPIGVQQLLKGMFKGVRAEFYAASSRSPEVYRGRPFLIEAAIAFGGELPKDEPARVIRFANRVPLLYQQSACSAFKGVVETNWRNYDLQQPRAGLPVGPLVVMIHMASVWVPFTSESKEAIADYDEIRKEMKLALMECGRKLGTYLRKRARMKREGERRDVFERYIGEIAKAIHAINGEDPQRLFEALLAQAKKRTAVADLKLDDEGKRVKEESDEDGVLIVAAPPGIAPASDGPPFSPSRAERAALEVAAMEKGEPAERPKRAKGRTAAAKPNRKPRAGSGPGTPAEVPPPPAPPASPSRKPKPRMRLVGGKMVPIDDGPGLF